MLTALAVCAWGSLSATMAAAGGDPRWERTMGRAAIVAPALMLLAALTMEYALISHDFHVSYVAQVGSRATPLYFTMISLWAALEGSLLFWALLLGGYLAVFAWTTRRMPGPLRSATLAVLFAITAFFAAVLVGPANPFQQIVVPPADGPGPNPLLQNHPVMGLHPPLLYLGFTGLSVPFALAVAALTLGELSPAWFILVRRWSMVAWIFLTAGLVAGAFWSYTVLGWGGYWGWDPVENAAVMPWLVITAFLHSVFVHERRQLLRTWTLTLVMLAFALAILGTFLTRSGVVASVHAFSLSPIGSWFLGLFVVVTGVGLGLLTWRSEMLQPTDTLDARPSREVAFLVNNGLLLAACGVILSGTLYPILAEITRGTQVTVGAPYFSGALLPILLGLVFLMGVGPVLPWGRGASPAHWRQLAGPLVAGSGAAGGLLVAGQGGLFALTVGLIVMAAGVSIDSLWRGWRALDPGGRVRPGGLLALFRLNPARYGGFVAHLGVLALALGVAVSSGFASSRQQVLRPGESVVLGSFTYRLAGTGVDRFPNRVEVFARLQVDRAGEPVASLRPALTFFAGAQQPVLTPDVHYSAVDDVYATLLAIDPAQGATVRVFRHPGVIWIWAGGLLAALGGLVALGPARRRRAPLSALETSPRQAAADPTGARA